MYSFTPANNMAASLGASLSGRYSAAIACYMMWLLLLLSALLGLTGCFGPQLIENPFRQFLFPGR